MPQLSEIVMPPHCTNLENLLELRETIKDLSQISILETKDLYIVFRAVFYRHVSVLIPYLENETNISKVAPFI